MLTPARPPPQEPLPLAVVRRVEQAEIEARQAKELAQSEKRRADAALRKALVIDETLGNQDGIARHYSNLGLIHEKRGNLKQARELWTKARKLYARVGVLHMMEELQDCLDGLPSEPPPIKRKRK